MKQILNILLVAATMICFVACGTVYYDATPVEVSTMEIPAEGGTFIFKVVNYTPCEETRFQPGEWFKEYRYRVMEDGVISEVWSEQNTWDYGIISIDFTPNDTSHTKEYTIDIKIADDFYKVDEEHIFGEWQTVWRITQPSMVGE